MGEGRSTWRVRFSGVVQGVGFRPCLYRMALERGLCGRVWNDAGGVELLLTALPWEIEEFLLALEMHPPVLARILRVEREETALAPFSDFRILPSRGKSRGRVGVSPDVGVCADCLRELFDPADRRFGYPFINCTNCGPRFSIVRGVPYDRSNTTMAHFPMCGPCAKEYADPLERRYHAQPDCCADCGPSLSYYGGAGEPVEGDALALAAARLKDGAVLALKGIGGLHLCCDAMREESVARLRAAKRREARPFALMCRDLEAARRLCHVCEAEAALLEGPQRPIVLLRKRERKNLSLCSENAYLGIMLPYAPLHYLLHEASGLDTLVMTSANLSGRPILYENAAALAGLAGIAEGFLLHDREIAVPCDDSILYCLDGAPYFLRRSRGYAPGTIPLPMNCGEMLACGAEQKASFALSKGKDAYMSQHIGDMKDLETLELYESMTAHFARLFDIRPRLLACDLHPDYLSSQYAAERAAAEGLPLVRVQHHHAHMAACMADNALQGPCIGLCWDGTGYGSDGTIWGGECLAGDYARVERLGSIRPIPLPGGDVAVREIWRLGAALLYDAGLGMDSLPACCDFPQAQSVAALLQSPLRTERASSVGRLFDAVYALCTGKREAAYEGQAAMLLEADAAAGEAGLYPLSMQEEGGILLFDHRPMLRALLEEKAAGVENALLFARFMNTLAAAGLALCEQARKRSGLGRVVLSGGVFFNQYLLRRMRESLAAADFNVYCHSRVSTGDEGIAFGQLAVAAAGKGGDGDVPCHTP